jgi:hypothetical protein
MKRSQILEKMVHCFNQCKVMRYSNDQAMDRVLDLIEEEGMLPPAFDVFEGRKNTFNDKMMINKWESEDETK